MQAVGRLGQKITQTCSGGRSRYEIELIKDWPLIAGTPLCRWCEPLFLRFPKQGQRREGVLRLAVLAGFTLDVQQLSPQIIERINAYFGYPMVAGLHIQQRSKLTSVPQTKEEPAKEVVQGLPEPCDDAIKNPALRESLQRLRALIQR